MSSKTKKHVLKILKMDVKNVAAEPILGYFVILDEMEKTQLAQDMKLGAGRGGVFYEKKELISTLQKNSALNHQKMHVVEVSVPKHCVISPNCIKFGIKHGHEIPINKIESFTDAMREFQ